MKHTLLPILLFIIAAQNTMAHATSLFDEVKPAVIDFFKRSAGNPKDCALLKDANAKNPQDEQTRMLMVGFCDSDIDFTKPVTFSAVSSHEFQGQRYICGVISGETSLGNKMGARFISAEPAHLVVGYKFSRRPIVFSANNDFLVDEFRAQVKQFNDLDARVCH
ncbi:hypothetical protein ACI09M_003918 [Cronobacter dublinensis]